MSDKKRIRLIPVAIGLVFLVGLGFFLSPYIGEALYKRRAREVIDRFESGVAAAEPDELELLYQRIQAYNRNLYETGQNKLTDPFAYQQVDFSLVDYGFDAEIIGALSIPQLGVELPVYLGASPENLHLGAAVMTQTSLPVGGENTNAVIAAHRGETWADMFRNIQRLQTGDQITLTNFRETLVYEVVEIKIISPTDVGEVLIQPGRDMLTLLTCHPKGQNRQRYIVYCERVIA